MIKEVKYNGHSAQPSDYGVGDGDLSTCIGVVPENGTLCPVMPAAKVLELDQDEKVMCLHVTNTFTHYIILNVHSGAVKWIDSEDTETVTLMLNIPRQEAEVKSIATIGNTVEVLTTAEIYYFLWKSDSDGSRYNYLGTHLPELPISFGLQGECASSDSFKVSLPDKIESDDILEDFSDDNVDAMTLGVLSKVNKFIAENATNAGKFIYPFFVRYAYRLYDQTLVMHSAPVLMPCTSGCAPYVFYKGNSGDESKPEMWVAGLVHQLDYAVTDSDALAELKNWSDIVIGVDIFISAPLYTYDQSGEVKRFTTETDNSFTVSLNLDASSNSGGNYYYKSKIISQRINAYNAAYYSGYRVVLPEKESVINDIVDCSNFYLLKSYDLDELQTDRTVVDVADDYLQSLVNRETMTDDKYSHDTLVPSYAYNYNSRMNLADLHKTFFAGYCPCAQMCYCVGDQTDTLDSSKVQWKVYVTINYNGQEITVSSPEHSLGVQAPFLFIFYPNANAYKATIQIGDTYYEVKLKAHVFLNGAYWFDGWDGLTDDMTVKKAPTVTDDPTVEILNYIYTSEVNNPFNFSSINAVGTGRIIALSSAAKPISPGQFGDFPLYAFASDGVWALTLNSDGSYSAKQVLTRDVAVYTDSVTQLDSAVIFATDRGLMLLTGGQTDCISDTINATEIFSPNDLPNGQALIDVYNSVAYDREQIELGDVTHIPFLDFVAECRMVYDYVHQRIIVYNTSVRYAYVYSLRSKSWGMMQTRMFSTVPSYPNALAMAYATDGETPLLVDFSKKSPAEGVTALIVTRPITIDDPTVLKTIDTIIQRGKFPKDNIMQVLYASNDLYNWFPVWSSTDRYLRGFSGSPWRAYRLALIASLKKAESIYGCTVQYTPKDTNRPR